MSQTLAELLGLHPNRCRRDDKGRQVFIVSPLFLTDAILEQLRAAATGPDGKLFLGHVQPFSLALFFCRVEDLCNRMDTLGRILFALLDCGEATKCGTVYWLGESIFHTADNTVYSEERMVNLADSFCRWAQIPFDRVSELPGHASNHNPATS
jgi:hypothetical protein